VFLFCPTVVPCRLFREDDTQQPLHTWEPEANVGCDFGDRLNEERSDLLRALERLQAKTAATVTASARVVPPRAPRVVSPPPPPRQLPPTKSAAAAAAAAPTRVGWPADVYARPRATSIASVSTSVSAAASVSSSSVSWHPEEMAGTCHDDSPAAMSQSLDAQLANVSALAHEADARLKHAAAVMHRLGFSSPAATKDKLRFQQPGKKGAPAAGGVKTSAPGVHGALGESTNHLARAASAPAAPAAPAATLKPKAKKAAAKVVPPACAPVKMEHFRLDFNRIPFVVGRASTDSFAVGANVQRCSFFSSLVHMVL
jgi:hypothetical protein